MCSTAIPDPDAQTEAHGDHDAGQESNRLAVAWAASRGPAFPRPLSPPRPRSNAATSLPSVKLAFAHGFQRVPSCGGGLAPARDPQKRRRTTLHDTHRHVMSLLSTCVSAAEAVAEPARLFPPPSPRHLLVSHGKWEAQILLRAAAASRWRQGCSSRASRPPSRRACIGALAQSMAGSRQTRHNSSGSSSGTLGTP